MLGCPDMLRDEISDDNFLCRRVVAPDPLAAGAWHYTPQRTVAAALGGPGPNTTQRRPWSEGIRVGAPQSWPIGLRSPAGALLLASAPPGAVSSGGRPFASSSLGHYYMAPVPRASLCKPRWLQCDIPRNDRAGNGIAHTRPAALLAAGLGSFACNFNCKWALANRQNHRLLTRKSGGDTGCLFLVALGSIATCQANHVEKFSKSRWEISEITLRKN